MNLVIKRITRIAIFTALICIIAPLSILTEPVPFTMQMLMLFLTCMILSPLDATFAIVTYIFLGFIGLPIFAGYVGGAWIVLGGSVTSGYIWAFPLMPLFFYLSKKVFKNKLTRNFIASFTSFTFVCLIGVIWMGIFLTSKGAEALTIKQLLMWGYVPFLPFNWMISAAIAHMLSNRINKIIQ